MSQVLELSQLSGEEFFFLCDRICALIGLVVQKLSLSPSLLLSVDINNKYKCTMDQELPDTAAYTLGSHFVCTHQIAALLCEMTACLPS